MNIDDKNIEKYLNMDESDIILIYSEIAYQKMMLKKYDFPDISNDQIREIIYPSSWRYTNDDVKIEALKEAIENKVSLMETEAINKHLKSL